MSNNNYQMHKAHPPSAKRVPKVKPKTTQITVQQILPADEKERHSTEGSRQKTPHDYRGSSKSI